MNFNVVLDKSALQALSYPELQRMTKYFKHLVTPVLAREILGDLSKNKNNPEKKVIELAGKLSSTSKYVSPHFNDLLVAELLGKEEISMDGRPHLSSIQIKPEDAHNRGYVLRTTPIEKDLKRWATGTFTEEELKYSYTWRSRTTATNLLSDLQKSLREESNLRFKNWEEVQEFIFNATHLREKQANILGSLLTMNVSNTEDRELILKRWFSYGCPHLSTFAPYGLYCYQVDLFLTLGLTSGFASTRPTSNVDLEYLYYLPFCNVFVTQDKFQYTLASLLIRNEQNLIFATDLKQDLNEIMHFLSNRSEKVQKQFNNSPPNFKSSIFFEIWSQFYDGNEFEKNQEHDDWSKEDYLNKAEELFNSIRNNEEFRKENPELFQQDRESSSGTK